jgi:hypothetical protein
MEDNKKWMTRRCEIMNRYTIPSMRAQNCEEYEWWIEVREDTIDYITPKLKLDGVPAVILPRRIVTDHSKGANSAWERDPAHVADRIKDDKFIEVRLNSDDMYHKNFIQTLQNMDIKPDTAVILPRAGLYWHLAENKLYKTSHTSPPFYALIYNTDEWLGGFRHPLPGGHRAARKLPNQDMPGRQWVWIIHDINNKIIRKGKDAYQGHRGKPARLSRLKDFGQ